MKHLRDYIEVNLPNAFTFGALTLAEFQALTTIVMLIVSTVCTVLITRHKIKSKKEDE